MPSSITKNTAIAVQSSIVHAHGGHTGMRDEALLESALTHPKNIHHYEQANVPQLAGCYAYKLVQNHPFLDGNKRTAYTCSRIFLKHNGYDLNCSPEMKVRIMIAIAANQIDEQGTRIWFEQHSTKHN